MIFGKRRILTELSKKIYKQSSVSPQAFKDEIDARKAR